MVRISDPVFVILGNHCKRLIRDTKIIHKDVLYSIIYDMKKSRSNVIVQKKEQVAYIVVNPYLMEYCYY